MKFNESPRGIDVLGDPALNKSTAFTEAERESLGLRGLLPPRICSQSVQEERVMENLRRKSSDIEKYIFLVALQHRNERLFYRAVVNYIEEIMPLIYTPTVGQACKEFAHIFRQPKGFYITANDRGRIREILDNWPHRDIRVIVITDGQRILGLGDLGANGMGIPIGKLALYVACAGIRPEHCLPVMLDVGTGNEELLTDPLYLGVQQQRLTGAGYFELVSEFVDAVQDAFPRALIQFEDFLTPNAYKLLNIYKDEVLCFNDDIQGTAAVALAGVYASTRISGLAFKDLRIMFLGAGSAATGIADLMVSAFERNGLSRAQAVERLWFVDHTGLVVRSRENLQEHNLPYAHELEPLDFLSAIDALQPHVLIGATGAPGTFTRQVIEAMARINPHPAIFALSNPTSRAECTAEQAYQWSEGRAIFASGSPFEPVDYSGQVHKPGQGNNAYIFPGIGLGAVASRATRITVEMFLAGAQTLAEQVSKADLERGSIYPPLSQIRDVSLEIAVAVAAMAWEQSIASADRPADLKQAIADYMYDPSY